MKKLMIFLLCVLVLATAGMTGVTVFAENEDSATAGETECSSGAYVFLVREGGAIITVADDTLNGEVTLPDKLNGYPVTGIMFSAFHGCNRITKLVLPSTVTSIGARAFENCTALKEIVLPSDLKTIKDYAFMGCNSLESIAVPEGVTALPEWVFANCTKLHTVTLGSRLETIGNGAFSGCSALSSLKLPDSVNKIGGYAFGGCSSLTSITIPEGVTEIEGIFIGCSSLDEVVLGKGITKISTSAFYGTKLYESDKNRVNGQLYIGDYLIDTNENISGEVVVKEGTLCISDQALCNREKITKLVLPDSIKTLPKGAFSSCVALTEIVLPKKLEVIPKSAFSDCTNLSKIEIPQSVTIIEENAFKGSGVAEITTGDGIKLSHANSFYDTPFYNDPENWGEDGLLYLGKYLVGINMEKVKGAVEIKEGTPYIPERAFFNGDSITSVRIPDSVTHIGYCAFYSCNWITELTLPERLEVIADQAFMSASGIKKVTFKGGLASMEELSFYQCYALKEMHGPKGAPAETFAKEQGITYVYTDAPMTDSSPNSDVIAFCTVIAILLVIVCGAVCMIFVTKKKGSK